MPENKVKDSIGMCRLPRSTYDDMMSDYKRWRYQVSDLRKHLSEHNTDWTLHPVAPSTEMMVFSPNGIVWQNERSMAFAGESAEGLPSTHGEWKPYQILVLTKPIDDVYWLDATIGDTTALQMFFEH